MRPDDNFSRRLWDLCDQQDGVLSHEQLTDHGLSRSAIIHRVRKGRLWPVFDLVYAVGRPQLSRDGRRRAALLSAGRGAALSHLTAAACWQICEEPARAEPSVSVLTRNGDLGRTGMVVHRPPTLTESDITEHCGLRVTTLQRTHLDLTLVLDPAQHKAALRESEYRYKLDLGALRRSLEGTGRAVRPGRLRRILDEWVPGIGLTESQLEAKFLEMCAKAELPLPTPQARVRTPNSRKRSRRADFLWPELRLVVEVDGYEAHRGRIAFQDDREKDRALKAAGYEVLRFTWAEVVGRPDDVAAELRPALARRAHEVARR